MNPSEPKINDTTTLENPRNWLNKRVNRIVRLPTITGAFFFFAKSGYDLVDYFYNGNLDSLNQFKNDINGGIGLTGFASSMYLKDRDPKLLDKDPLWKRAYKRLEEFVSYNPPPQPVRIPIPSRN
ncbi:MAG TPA: hypothetical protein VJJ52_07275 [Candidatus Nanoarchaeia archaeon]|nr:hypothetical protein [Candidatus Nanoarchaeia archaeon]